MNKFIFTIFMLSLISMANAQDIEYEFGYLFNHKLNDKVKIILTDDSSKVKTDTLGTFEQNGNTVLITKKTEQKISSGKEFKILSKLKGIIKERNKDTLFVKFWDIVDSVGIVKNKSNNIDSTLNGKTFALKIKPNSWKTTFLSKGKHFDIPYRFGQLLATNIPFRVLTKSGTLESDFLNANISYARVFGITRIYKSEFVKPRNRYFAFGPYVGLSAIDNLLTSNKEFGINYGGNLIGD